MSTFNNRTAFARYHDQLNFINLPAVSRPHAVRLSSLPRAGQSLRQSHERVGE
jgi:hypothetical protein